MHSAPIPAHKEAVAELVNRQPQCDLAGETLALITMSDTYSENMPRNETEAKRYATVDWDCLGGTLTECRLDEQFELTTQDVPFHSCSLKHRLRLL